MNREDIKGWVGVVHPQYVEFSRAGGMGREHVRVYPSEDGMGGEKLIAWRDVEGGWDGLREPILLRLGVIMGLCSEAYGLEIGRKGSQC